MKKLILSRLTLACAALTLNIITSTDLVACDSNITLDHGLCHTFDNGTVALIDVAKVSVAAGFSAATYTASAAPEALSPSTFGGAVLAGSICVAFGVALERYLPQSPTDSIWG